MIIAKLHFEQRVPDHIVGALPDVLDQPRFGGNSVERAPLRTVARVQHVKTESQTLKERHRRELQQIDRRAKLVVASVEVERGARCLPVQFRFETEFAHEIDEVVVRAANEVIEPLNGKSFEAKRAG